MDELGGIVIGISLIIGVIVGILWLIRAILWSVFYLAYVAIFWTINFINSYQILFYGFSLVLVILSIRWFSKSRSLEQDSEKNRNAHKLMQQEMARIKDELNRGWQR